MNKILMLSCGVLLISTAVFASDTGETCADGAGKVVVGVSGHKYCLNKSGSNWWNAYAWCDAQGRRLIDLSDCGCSGVVADCANNVCVELVGSYTNNYYAWTSRPASGTSNIYIVTLLDGKIQRYNRASQGMGWGYALCY